MNLIKFSLSVSSIALTSLLFCVSCGNNSVSANFYPNQVKTTKSIQRQSNNLPSAIANRILRDASKRSGVPKSKLKITQAIAKTFGNLCELKFGEICTKEYKPIQGWEVVVRVRDNSWTYHVNKSGTQIVLDPKATV